MNGKILRVGLAIGGGTGPELAEIFERTLRELAAREKMRAEIIRSPREYRTYRPMAALTSAEAARATEEDAADYIRFVRELAADGIRVAFRTAFNAQSLYLVRDELLGVKVEPMQHSDGELLLIRDETQGFYSGRNDQPADPLRIRRETLFSRENTWRVLDFSIENAAARWGGREHIDRIIVACKFHLLENRFAQWVRDYERERSVRIHLYQPDTTNRQLMRGAFDGRTVLVGSNEWGDIMHAELIARFGLGHQEERCARNFFLHPDIAGFVEYQTVHGSADDIAGRGIVNPVATLRAAARVIEEFTGSPRIVDAMEEALGAVARENIATPDAGGSSTNEVVDAVLTAIMNPNGRTLRTTRADRFRKNFRARHARQLVARCLARNGQTRRIYTNDREWNRGAAHAARTKQKKRPRWLVATRLAGRAILRCFAASRRGCFCKIRVRSFSQSAV